MQTKQERKLLDELIYHRFKELLPIERIAMFEQDLASALARSMGDSEVSRVDAEAMVRRRINKCWRRLESDWNRLRSDPTATIGFFDPSCPACVSLGGAC